MNTILKKLCAVTALAFALSLGAVACEKPADKPADKPAEGAGEKPADAPKEGEHPK